MDGTASIGYHSFFIHSSHDHVTSAGGLHIMSGYTAVNLKAVIIAHTVARVRTAVAWFVTCTVALCFNEQQNKKK